MKTKNKPKKNLFDLLLRTNMNSLYTASFECEFTVLELPFVLSNVINSLLKKFEPFEDIEEIYFTYKSLK